MTTRILIFGSSGLLGGEFASRLGSDPRCRLFPYRRQQADITRSSEVRRALRAARPHIVINCAAMIDVDACERDPLRAWMVNAVAPGIIVRAMADAGLRRSRFFHISTSDVFGGHEPSHREDDPPQPVNVYGWSKLGGEMLALAEAHARGMACYIIRSGWLYGARRNTFIDLVIRALRAGQSLKVITDQRNIPTWTRDVVASCRFLIFRKRRPGIYHVAGRNAGRPSRHDIAKYLARLLGVVRPRLRKVRQRDVFSVERPSNAVLVNTRGLSVPDWRISLREYLTERRAPDRVSFHFLRDRAQSETRGSRR